MLENSYLSTVAPSTIIYVDNQGVIRLTENAKYHKKTKYILLKYYKICELVNNDIITFKSIHIVEIVVDSLTKSLGASKFKDFVSILGFVDL